MGVTEPERSTPVTVERTTDVNDKTSFASEPYIYQPYIHHVIPEMKDEFDGGKPNDEKKNFETMMKLMDLADHDDEGASNKVGASVKKTYDVITQAIKLAGTDPFPDIYCNPDDVGAGPGIPPLVMVAEASDGGGDDDQSTAMYSPVPTANKVVELKKEDARKKAAVVKTGSCASQCCTVL